MYSSETIERLSSIERAIRKLQASVDAIGSSLRTGEIMAGAGPILNALKGSHVIAGEDSAIFIEKVEQEQGHKLPLIPTPKTDELRRTILNETT